MMVMPGNEGGTWIGYLAGKYPGRIGSLVSPNRWNRPFPFIPHSLDNGAYVGFNTAAFLAMIEKAKRFSPPRWLVVPDKWGDKEATLALWRHWEPLLRPLGWPLAMAIQDGMTPDDFRGDIAFIGGSDKRWQNIQQWRGLRFHIGRVNTERHLWMAHEAGAESCDGSGWFRDVHQELPGLLRYLDGVRDTTGHLPLEV